MIHKNLIQLKNEEMNNPIKNGQKSQLSCSEEAMWIANKDMRRCSTSLVIREMQMKSCAHAHQDRKQGHAGE